MIARISTVEAKAQISEAINRVAYGGEQIIITRRGKDLVALIPVEQLARLAPGAEAPTPAAPQPRVPAPKAAPAPEREKTVQRFDEEEEMEISLL